ncbi:hypothetical protein [Roseateles chitinivorans]|uniref:hypothetical protein n=1 Tax=Roseateles chitinivorans TaxID=2917965 RepID=UPI001E59F84E|nr:hypothetical protein [Roseateles chitinivorans]
MAWSDSAAFFADPSVASDGEADGDVGDGGNEDDEDAEEEEGGEEASEDITVP